MLRPMASINPPPAWRKKQVLPQGILTDTLSLNAGPNSLSELGQFRLSRRPFVFQELPPTWVCSLRMEQADCRGWNSEGCQVYRRECAHRDPCREPGHWERCLSL